MEEIETGYDYIYEVIARKRKELGIDPSMFSTNKKQHKNSENRFIACAGGVILSKTIKGS